MYCGNCGADIAAHLRFCTTCGAPTDNEETRVATEETRVAAPRTALERAPGPVAPGLPTESPRTALRRAANDDEEERQI